MINLFQIGTEPSITITGNQFFLLTVINALLLIIGIIIWGFNRRKHTVGAIYIWMIVFAILTLTSGFLHYIDYTLNFTSSDFYTILIVTGILLFSELVVMIYLRVNPLILFLDILALVFLGTSTIIFCYKFAADYVLIFYFLSLLQVGTSLNIWVAVWLNNRRMWGTMPGGECFAKCTKRTVTEKARKPSRIIEESIKKPSETVPKSKELRLSIAYPRLLSKGHDSPFKVMIYPPCKQRGIIIMLRNEFEKSNIEHVHDTDLTPGLTVIIKLSSLNIEFSDEVTKRLRDKIDYAYFVGKPKETCHLGENIVMLSVTDKTTDHEYMSKPFKVEVVDYAFDHVSRPLLSRVTSTLSGLAATVTYALVLFGQIDTAFGLVSGTAASVFALLIYRQFQSSFQKPNVVIDFGKSQL